MSEPDAWSAPPAAVATGLVAAVGLLAWVGLGASTGALDAPGRLLLGIAGLLLGVAAVVGWRARPRLAADDDALVLRTVLGPRRWPWARVDAVRSVRMRRLGMPAAYLEIDARDDDGTERLLVLGRLELGTDPVEVAEALQDRRARAGRGGSAQAAGGDRRADDGAEGEVADEDRDEQGEDDGPGDGEARRRA